MMKAVMRMSRSRGQRWPYGLVAVILIGSYTYWAAVRPLPPLQPESSSVVVQTKPAASQLTWPAAQAAVGIVDTPIIEVHEPQVPLPTASTAKLITALAVLSKRPLQPGESGPVITLSANDVALYDQYAAQGGSVVQVTAGEQLSEYQALEAMMLPSANNIADSLAIWAFGSLSAYRVFANNYVHQLGLSHTHIGADASGFNPSTTSSAYDLVLLGEHAMQNPVLAQIVGQRSVTNFPLVNTIQNVNYLLGTDNIIGIKTGNNDQDGGVFVSASHTTINHKLLIIVTAVMGAHNLWEALHDSEPLVRSAQSNFKPTTVISAGQTVGSYKLPWDGTVSATASKDLRTDTWSSSAAKATVTLHSLTPGSRPGQDAGSATLSQSATADKRLIPVKLQGTPNKPSLGWRLLHPFD